jgi:glucokinase
MEKVIGIDLGGTNLKSGLISRDGKLEHLHYQPAEAGKGPKQVIENLLKAIEHQLNKHDGEIRGIGIGAAGQVDFKTGVVIDPPNFPDWHEEPLGDIVREKFGLPTFVDNDANVAALAEQAFGAGRDSDNFILVTLGTGVGSGLVLNGRLFHGAAGAAGEFGHTTIQFDGPVCNCGNRGCIERYVGARWIVERAMDALPHYPESILNQRAEEGPLTPKVISETAKEGDALARRVLEEVGTFLGIALASVLNLLNLDLVIIGGGVSNAGDLLFKPVERAIRRHAMSVPAATVRVRRAQMGEHAGIIGAGQLAFEGLAKSE